MEGFARPRRKPAAEGPPTERSGARVASVRGRTRPDDTRGETDTL